MCKTTNSTDEDGEQFVIEPYHDEDPASPQGHVLYNKKDYLQKQNNHCGVKDTKLDHSRCVKLFSNV